MMLIYCLLSEVLHFVEMKIAGLWVQDIATLGVLNVRHGGYIATVKVQGKESDKVGFPSESIELADQPDGGANALNINRYCMFSHKKYIEFSSKYALQSQSKYMLVYLPWWFHETKDIGFSFILFSMLR